MTLLEIYQRLYACYGPQHWWPADTAFEVMVGAILTQNTAWIQVERAIAGLRAAGLLDRDAILDGCPTALAAIIRPAGFKNLKTRRLKSLCLWLREAGGEAVLAGLDTAGLRRRLLAVQGVGPETADDILLYAFDRPVFVIDAYTRRLGERLGLCAADAPYETLRRLFESGLPMEAPLFNEFHALIVRHAKVHCRKSRPVCAACPLRTLCPGVQAPGSGGAQQFNQVR